jgi:hypothetical protein
MMRRRRRQQNMKVRVGGVCCEMSKLMGAENAVAECEGMWRGIAVDCQIFLLLTCDLCTKNRSDVRQKFWLRDIFLSVTKAFFGNIWAPAKK